MARLIPTFALALLVTVSGFTSRVSAQPGVVDQGTFRITVQGREVGTEEFAIRQSGTGTAAEVTAVGKVSVRLPTGTLELTPRLRATGVQTDPVAYQVDVGGDAPTKIVGTVARGRFSARIVSPSGEQLREYVTSAGALVLDEGVAHHYYFLAQRLRSGRVPIIVPRENRQVIAAVSSRGEKPVVVAGRSVNLFHLVVEPAGGSEQHVWVDALSRVIKVEIPSRSYVAVRTELPR